MSQDQRAHIIKTAGELFFRLGIRSVSIDDICRELGMSKKTFYVYFGSKDELVEQLLRANVEYVVAHKTRNFGNARYIRNLFERSIQCQANRFSGKKGLSERQLTELTAEDIETAFKKQ
jgi:AcrR family transcriptional regulator